MRFHVLIADDVDPAFVLKRGWTRLRVVMVTDAKTELSRSVVEMGLRRTGNLSDAEQVVRVWPDVLSGFRI